MCVRVCNDDSWYKGLKKYAQEESLRREYDKIVILSQDAGRLQTPCIRGADGKHKASAG